MGEAVDCLIELGELMDLSSSAYVSSAARVPDFQALGGFGSKCDGNSEQVSFSSLYLAINFMRR